MPRLGHSLLVAGLMLWSATPLAAQARTVSGTVRSRVVQTVGAPLQTSVLIANATVRLASGGPAARTNASGQFTITIPAGATGPLIVTHPDYETAEIDLSDAATLEILLVTSIRYNQYGVRVDRKPITPETRDGLLVFETRDGNYRFWFDARVQVDGALIWGDKYNANGSGAEVRRARMAMKSQFTPNWYGEIDMDFADSRADLKDAYLMWMPTQNLNVRWGNFKEVFSMEQNTSSRYLTFMERPMTTRAFTPSRHLGTNVSWVHNWALLAGGVHFGDVGGWEEVQNRKDNNADFGADEGFSLTGKLVLMPWYNDMTKGVHIGLASSLRTPKLYDQIDAVRFDVRGPANVNRRKYVDTDRIRGVDRTIHSGYEFGAYRNSLRVSGEVNTVHLTFDNDSLTAANFGGHYVAVSKLLFGGHHQYNARDGEFTQPALGRSWGDVELAARYEYIDVNSPKAGITGGESEAWTIGINFMPNNNVKFVLNYSLVNNDRFANGRGKLFVGTDSTGALTRNPALVTQKSGKAGEDYKALALRVQVSF